MKNSETIAALLRNEGAAVEIVQEDDGGGFTVLKVHLDELANIEVTVSE